jgi:hypothetical protein
LLPAIGLTVANLMSGAHLWLTWIGPVQILVDLFVFSITYVSLIDISRGFKQRLWYRLWAPLQHRFFPNVMRLWWYLLALAPMWVLMWSYMMFTPFYCAGPAACS